MTTVLFTPGGSGMAVTGIKALSEASSIRTVAVDIDELAPGLHLADAGYTVPRFDDDAFFPSLCEIVRQEKVDIVWPTLDPILTQFQSYRSDLASLGVKTMLSPRETVEIARDKWRTYREFSDELPFPASTIDLSDTDASQEYFVKPRCGSGSKGAYRPTSQADLRRHYNALDDPIVQRYLPGTEYTVDCLTGRDGSLLACIPRRRVEMTAGISTKVELVKDERLRQIAEGIADELSFTGPFFFQAKEDPEGIPKITEIGPRIAGTMFHGFCSPNLHVLAVLQLRGETVSEPTIRYDRQMTRHWEEVIVEEDADSQPDV